MTAARENALWAQRRAGVLLPVRSLPDGPGNGDLGPQAARFVDFSVSCGWSVWQVLPVGPPDASGSPYLAKSSCAGDPELIGLEPLVELGWIDGFRSGITDPVQARAHRRERLQAAYAGFLRQADPDWMGRLSRFCAECPWLDDFALFSVIDVLQGGASWVSWPQPLRDREPTALDAIRQDQADGIDQIRFEQFLFATQWQALREHARRQSLFLLGDLPMFVAHHSVDVWKNRRLFRLDDAGQPRVVAGVPPDYFSTDGQRWGNPLYDWDEIAAENYAWWIDRVGVELTRFDALRLDHFRGLEATWEIPAQSKTARDGHWHEVPGQALLEALARAYGPLPLVAEDLGVITKPVVALRDRFGLPGMRVLQFAFDGTQDNPHLPHHHVPNAVVYTGTHDNPPSEAWGLTLDPQTRTRVREYCGREHESMAWSLVLAALASVAQLAVIPLQDWLGLGEGSRINTPGTESGNWRWRFSWDQIPSDLPARSSHWVRVFGR